MQAQVWKNVRTIIVEVDVVFEDWDQGIGLDRGVPRGLTEDHIIGRFGVPISFNRNLMKRDGRLKGVRQGKELLP